MKKRFSGLLLLAALGGCVENQPGSFMSNVGPGGAPNCSPSGCMNGQPYVARAVPGVVGPLGEPLTAPPGGTLANPMPAALGSAGQNEAQIAARQTFAQSLPPQIAAQILSKDDQRKGVGLLQSGIPAGGIMQAGGPPPPSELMRAGGPLPPGGGIMQTAGGPPGFPGGNTTVQGPVPPVANPAYGVVAAIGALKDGPGPFTAQRTSVRFAAPAGMKVSWFVPGADGKPELAPNALEVPGRYNFLQAAIYRIKLNNIPGRPGLELYPTLEVVPANSKTTTFLAHTSVPLTFTQEDFDQVAAGNYLVKVVYLPNPQFQDLAVAGPNEIVSSRLEPGADPIAEALQRGSIPLIVRMGNIDLEAPNTPSMDAPSPYQPKIPGGGLGPYVPTPGMPGPGLSGPGFLPRPGIMPSGLMAPGMGNAMMTPGGPGGFGGPGGPGGFGGPGGPGGPGMFPAMMGPGLPPGGPMMPASIPPGAPPGIQNLGAFAPPSKSVQAAMMPPGAEEPSEPVKKPERKGSPWSRLGKGK